MMFQREQAQGKRDPDGCEDPKETQSDSNLKWVGKSHAKDFFLILKVVGTTKEVYMCVCVCWTLYMYLQILFSSTLYQTLGCLLLERPGWCSLRSCRLTLVPPACTRATNVGSSMALGAQTQPCHPMEAVPLPATGVSSYQLSEGLGSDFHRNASIGNGKDSTNRFFHPVLPPFSGIWEA